MKRNTLLFSLLLVATTLFGQSKIGIEHLTENFSSSFPPSGWTIDAQSSNWSASQSANAGGTSPEARFAWNPEFNGTSRLISPKIDLTGVDLLVLDFKHAVDHYSGSYTIGAATRSNSGDWNVVWSMAGANVIKNINISIDNDDVGASDFELCFYFSGNSYNINYWYIDDIMLYTPFETDIMAQSINLESYISQGEYSVSAILKNVGINDVTSFDIEYQINNGSVISESITGVTLNSGDIYTHAFSQTWQASPGSYSLTVSAVNINNAGDDDDPENNTLTKTINVASKTVPNMPLFESFTSSTCPPCYTFNINTFTPFLEEHHGEYAIIKYQMSWPGNGDPYYTAEGGVRRQYYGVSAVPQLFTGGVPTATSATGLNNAFNQQSTKDAFFEIKAYASTQGTMVNAEVRITPHISATGLKLRAAVIENKTTGNVGSNGETEFHYVMMKMLPDANGTTVNFVDGVPYSISFSQNMSGTFVEEMSDLSLVVFIQNDSNKEIFQSKMVEMNAAKILTFDFTDTSVVDVVISDVEDNMGTITVTVAQGTDVASLTPTITISEGATINPAPVDNAYSAMDFTSPVEFVVTDFLGTTVYTYSVSVEFETSVSTHRMLMANIYPNPSEGNFAISIPNNEGKVQVDVFTVTGNAVYSQVFGNGNDLINISLAQPKGVYIVRIKSENGLVKTGKLIIK